MEAPIKTKNGRYHSMIGPPDKINYTISQQVVSNPYVQQPNSSNIIKIIQFVAYRYVVTISSIIQYCYTLVCCIYNCNNNHVL